jgi:hypothetical protein
MNVNMACLRYYLGIPLEELRQNHQYPQSDLCPGRNSHLAPPQYEYNA